MDRFRIFARRIHCCWTNFVHQVWPAEPKGEYFRLLDYMLGMAASTFEPKTKRQQVFWKWYRRFSLYHTLYLVLNAIEHLDPRNDLISTIWYATIGVEAFVGHGKDFLLNQHFDTIRNARNFINGRSTLMTEGSFESNARKRYFRYIQVMCSVIFFIVCMQVCVMLIPSSQLKEMIDVPGLVRSHAPSWLSDGLYYLFKITVAPIWLCKVLCSTALVISLLVGFKTELTVLANRLENILDQVRSDIDQHPTISTSQNDPQYQGMFLKYMKLHVNQCIECHIELLDNLQEFQPFVEQLFFVLYYHAMLLISTYVFVILQMQVSSASVMIIAGVGAYLIKCYFWCRIINSFEDINDCIEGHIMQLITGMPHSKKYHSEYVALRSTLMIMKIHTRSSVEFSCGGIFSITVEVFANLLNTVYSLLTFLLNANAIEKD